jgi:hypothetical protein
MKVPFSTSFEMTAQLSMEEVARRLRAVVPQFMVFPVPTVPCPVDGRIKDHSCTLHLRRNVFRNPGSESRLLDLKFFSVPEGTLLQGQFRFSWSSWLAVPFSVAFAIFFIDAYKHGVFDDDAFAKYFLAAVFIVVMASAAYLIWSRRDYDSQTERFLRDLLNDGNRS